MISTDYPQELSVKIASAIKNSFISCRDDEQRHVVEVAVVEFLSALSFSAMEAISVLKMADGSDSETDDVIDRMIEEFKSEI